MEQLRFEGDTFFERLESVAIAAGLEMPVEGELCSEDGLPQKITFTNTNHDEGQNPVTVVATPQNALERFFLVGLNSALGVKCFRIDEQLRTTMREFFGEDLVQDAHLNPNDHPIIIGFEYFNLVEFDSE